MDISDDEDDDFIDELDLNGLIDESSEDSVDELIHELPTPPEPDDAQHFDIALAAEHTYLGEGVEGVGGAAGEAGEARRAGRRLEVPALAAPGPVFPGELVPLRPARAAARRALLHPDRLLALLLTDAAGQRASGLGTLCEVEAAAREPDADGAVSLKARAVSRVAVCADRADRAAPAPPPPHRHFDSPQSVRVLLLPEGGARCSLRAAAGPRAARLLDAAAADRDPEGLDRRAGGRRRALLRSAAASTPWPAFVFEMYSPPRLRALLVLHFQHHGAGVPAGGWSEVSAWACANASLPLQQRVALFNEDGALSRLVLLLRMLAGRSQMLHCVNCGLSLAKASDEIAMTTTGVHGLYANPGGYTHDVVTLRRARGLRPAGAPSADSSWFPGYTWQVALCAACRRHKGWRFEAVSERLVPQRFFALCRNYVMPHPPPPDPR